MSDEMRQFLVIYNRKTDEVTVDDLGIDAVAAAETYTRVECDYEDRPEIEVVLIGSDSIDTIRHTHANYFTEGRPLSEVLAPN